MGEWPRTIQDLIEDGPGEIEGWYDTEVVPADLARELYEAGKALHAQAIDAGVRHLDPTLLDVNLALARYEQECGESDGECRVCGGKGCQRCSAQEVGDG